ncbi:MAG: S8 family serine peptidase, partial [Xanthomonadales bacterium]|nr:S8 family serine peptidase [Xanthomonadales bacterium]
NNIYAADTVSTDEIWPGGTAGLNLSGTGFTIGEWDAGAIANHTEFTGRLTQVDISDIISKFAPDPVIPSNHSTHVAGTLAAAGDYAPATGMAHDANLHAHDWDFDTSEMITASLGNMLVSNHSYGIAAGWLNFDKPAPRDWMWIGGDANAEDWNFGYYSDVTETWDQVAYDAPHYLIVKAVGNDRQDFGPCNHDTQTCPEYTVIGQDGDPDDDTLPTSTAYRVHDCAPYGYDCVPSISVAKNILTVGAVETITGGYNPTVGPPSVVDVIFSAWGPTDDGRIKPDLVGDGFLLVSTWAQDGILYAPAIGTSMASPNVAGSLLLLQEHYENLNGENSFMRAATLKALAIHTADEAGGAPGPDYEFGWGLLNTNTAATVITESGGSHRIIEGTLSNGETETVQINVNEPDAIVRATLVWSDPPATPVAPSLDPSDLMLVNDLDLRIQDSTSTHMPWVLNPAMPSAAATRGDNFRDNVEQVLINGGGPGAYFITVNHKGNLLDINDQDYSLIISVSPRFSGELATVAAEDFSEGLPGGWSIVQHAGPEWTVIQSVEDGSWRENRTGGDDWFAVFTNDYSAPPFAELRTPSFDFSSYSVVNMQFKTELLGDDLELPSVDYSTNGGASWTTVWGGYPQIIFGPSTQFPSLNVAAGHPDVIIRFLMNGDGYYAGGTWQVDDVVITGISGLSSGGACGGIYNLPANQWRLISLPCEPDVTDTVTTLFGDDLNPADYDSRWVMYTRNEATDQYVKLGSNDPVSQGEGIFLFSLDAGLLDTSGTATPLVNSADCPSPDGNCFEIPLVKPADNSSERPNMLGHPLPYPVNWANFRLRVSGDPDSPLTPSEAEAKGFMMKETYKYSGSAYIPFDDVTPGYDHGALGSFDGFWARLMTNSFNAGDMTLLVPNTRSDGVITTANVAPISSSLQTVTYSDNTMSSKTAMRKGTKVSPGLAKREEHRNKHRQAGRNNEEWYVRLIAESVTENLKDDGNVLGQLQDSSSGFDEHDLPEPAPFEPYLTIVFNQPDWGDNAGDYTSDFHPVTGNNKKDNWSFVVVSDDHEREVTLSWSGPEDALKNSLLVDLDNGEVIEPDKLGRYTFFMNGERRNFAWEYVKRPFKSKKK